MTDTDTPEALARSRMDVSKYATPMHSELAPLQLTVFNPGTEGLFPVTSTIVAGTQEAMLVDAQFQKQHAHMLIQMIRDTGKTLKYIYISHSDPDYYFGLAEITEAFPDAGVISTAQTAYLISATKDAKLQIWKEKLGANAPSRIVVPEGLAAEHLSLDGQTVTIRGNRDDPAHSYLWIPSVRTVLGGVSVSTRQHLWMADTPSYAAIEAWLRIIVDMKNLKPERVIPGHFLVADWSPFQLDFIRDYLVAFQQAVLANKTSEGIVAAMVANFPDLTGRNTLEFGAKVFAGEVDWHTAGHYPPIGRVAVVDFGGPKFRLNFTDERTMSLEDTSGAFAGVKDTVQYTAVEVSRGVFMVYWHEQATGSNVVHVQDWNSGAVYTNIAVKDGSFLHFKGTIGLSENGSRP